MSLQDVNERYPNTSSPKAVGYGRSFLSVDTVKNSELREVKSLKLEMVDERVVKVTAYYPKDLNWTTDDLSQRTAEAMKLDGSWSKTKSEHSDFRSMYCGNTLDESFVVRVGIGPPRLGDEKLPYVEVENHYESFQPDSRRIDAEKETNQKKEEQKQIFKP